MRNKYVWGRSEASRTQKHCFVYDFLTVYAPSTQQTLLLQCLLAFIISEHIKISLPCVYSRTQKHVFVECVPVCSASRTTINCCSMCSCFFCFPNTNKLFVNVFLLCLLPEHKTLYLFNVFLLSILYRKVQREGR